ncbi:MAG: ZIP family metal transporter [Acidobacteria bacterium]|nr:ZIP family metal transporter [Acidobacteriota bacterium]
MTDLITALDTLPPAQQALAAGCFTWVMTALGAATVFLKREPSRRSLDTSLGAAAGIMIAASFWSLLAPALELAEEGPLPAFVPVSFGFLVGGLGLFAVDRILPHVHPRLATAQAEGIHTTWRRQTLLVLAITLHNVPEGLAVGVAFAAAASGFPEATIGAAVALALGMGLQNVPEGAAVSFPLRREGVSAVRSFWYGQVSGIVEPIAAVLGAVVVLQVRGILPYALAFAAGAMIFVVVEELIPEAQRAGDTDAPTIGALLGFVLMMVLDTAIG